MTTFVVECVRLTVDEASQALDIVCRESIPPTQVKPGHKFSSLDSNFVATLYCAARNEDDKFTWETVCWYLKAYVSTLKFLLPSMQFYLRDFVPSEFYTRIGGVKGSVDSYRAIDGALSVTTFVKLVKSWSTTPESLLLSNCGTKEFTSPLYGKARSYLLTFLKQGKKKTGLSKQAGFANTCLQMKRVASIVPDSFVDSNKEAFKARLNTVYRTTAQIDDEYQKLRANLPGTSDFLTDFHKASRRLLQSLKHEKVVFADYRDEEIKNLSMRSTIESPVKKNGSFGYFTEARDLEDDAEQSGYTDPCILSGRSLKGLRKQIRSDIWSEIRSSIEEEFYFDNLVRSLETTDCDTLSQHRTLEQHFAILKAKSIEEVFVRRYSPVNLIDTKRPFIRRYEIDGTKIVTYLSRILPTYGETLERARRIIRYQRNVVGICEPLKVRIITVHHAYEAVLFAKEAEDQQQSFLKSKEILSGKIITADSYTQIGEFLKRHPEGLVVSDDGDAATDSINHDVVSAGLEENFSEELNFRLKESLSGEFTSTIAGQQVRCGQTTGQMMGARYSFVLLCKTHYIWKKLFLCNMKYKAIDQVFFINGDDGVICLKNAHDVKLYKDWMSTLWSLNPMKTYVSRHYFSFNSEMRLTKTGQLVPMVRWNVIRGIDKFGNNSKDPTLYNLVVKDALGLIPERELWKFFIGNPHWRGVFAALDEKTDGASNWFLPKPLGGYGIERQCSFAITKRQLSLVKYWDRFDIKRLKRHVTKTVPSAEDKLYRAEMNVKCRLKSYKLCKTSELGTESYNPNARNIKLKTIDTPALKVVPLPHSLGRDRDIVRIAEFWERSLLNECFIDILHGTSGLTGESNEIQKEFELGGQGPESN